MPDAGVGLDVDAPRAGELGGALGGLAGEALPFGGTPVPLSLDVRIASDDGRSRVVSGGGTVAGLPVDPIARALASAVVARL